MIGWVLVHVAPFALQIGVDQLKKYASHQISQKVIEKTHLLIENEINLFLEGISNRTQQYLIFSAVNMISLVSFYFFQKKYVLFLALFVSIGFLVYLLRSFVKTFIKIIDCIENFEKDMKELITNELKKAKDKNLKQKMALFFDKRSEKEYYNLVLGQIVQSISNWLIGNRKLLYYRVFSFFVASACFSLSLRELL